MKNNHLLTVFAFATTMALLGCDPDACVEVTEIMTSEVSPAGVRTLFQVSDCDGNPVPNITSKDVSIRLDGKAMQSEGNATAILNQDVAFQLNTLLLLDLSDSIVQNGNLQGMVTAAKQLVSTLARQGHTVAIYQFAGPSWFGPVTGFTSDGEQLNAALDTVAQSNGLGTTDLYGSIPKAVRILESQRVPAILSAESLVLFTDGTDEAMTATASAARRVIARSDVNVFTVGLGGDVNKDELKEFGKNGFEWAANTTALKTAFAKITARIRNIAKSYYLMGVCSPRVGDIRTLEIEVHHDGAADRLRTHYDASGFDIVGCDPQQVAYPCASRQCGETDGFVCGTCGQGEYCSDDGQCREGCPASVECGMFNGVFCGECPAGTTLTCQQNSCIEACENAQCGVVDGMDCGSCDTGLECNDVNQCVPVAMDTVSWIAVPGTGTTLGCDWSLDSSCDSDEARVSVVLGDYYIMQSEVTAGMYAACVADGDCNPTRVATTTGCTFTGSTDSTAPINCISWEGLDEFCQYLGGELPTEAQWEYAARSGYDGVNHPYRIYPWGNAPTPDCTRVVMNQSGPGCGTGYVLDTRSLQPSELGLHDMMGNVSEWTADWYAERLGGCPENACTNPKGPATGDERVIRGGSFNSMYASAFRTAAREKESPTTTSTAIGGRCVLNRPLP